MNQRDQLWKAIIEDLFEDFLRFFFRNADSEFDFSRGFEYLDKELEQLFPPGKHHHKVRYADKLVKVFTRDKREEWGLLHVETQGYPDKFFAKRMFQYFIRIWDRYDKRITAIVIFTDGGRTHHPSFFSIDYMGTRVRYDFNTYKVMEALPEVLQQSNNPFAQVVLTAQAYIKGKKLHNDMLYNFNINLVKDLLKKELPKEKVRKIMNFLAAYVHFENPEMNGKFTEEIEALTTKEKETMGIMEYLSQQAEEARAEERKAAEKRAAREQKDAKKRAILAAKTAREEERKAAEAQTVLRIKKMIQVGQLTDDQIADIMDVPLAHVKDLRTA